MDITQIITDMRVLLKYVRVVLINLLDLTSHLIGLIHLTGRRLGAAVLAGGLLVGFAALAGCGGGGGGASLAPPTPDVQPELPPPNEMTAQPSVFRTQEFGRQHGLGAIGAEHAYARGYFGQGVTVAVVDSGVLTTHVELQNNIVPGYRFTQSGDALTTDITDPDPDGHGTAVAAIIAGERHGSSDAFGMHGIAPQAKIMPFQIGADTLIGFRLVASAPQVLSLAMSVNIPIVNNSFGRIFRLTGSYSGQPETYVDTPLLLHFWDANDMNLAVSIANVVEDNDTVLVWAAGNERWNRLGGEIAVCQYGRYDILDRRCKNDPNGPMLTVAGPAMSVSVRDLIDNFVSNDFGALSTLAITVNGRTLRVSESDADFYAVMPVRYPQLMDQWLVAVGIDERNINTSPSLSSFSNGCGHARFWCLAAPGSNIYSADNSPSGSGYRQVSGTSFAAPHVSGALAVLKNRLPHMPMSVARALLLVSADDLGQAGVDDEYGWGFINLERAITLQSRFELADPALIMLPPANPIAEPPANFHTPEFLRQYGLGAIKAEHAYARGYFGQGVTVGVVDTGALTTHPDLRDNYVTGFNAVTGNNVIDDPITDAYNSIGHGTAVAGIIAAQMGGGGTHGVAPQAKIMPLQFANTLGRLRGNVDAAFHYATERDVPIINNSWGTTRSVVGTYRGTRYYARVPDASDPIPSFPNRTHQWAAFSDEDVVFVWSAGNGGWHEGSRGVRLCDDINSGYLPDRGCQGNRIHVSPEDLINEFVLEGYSSGNLVITVSVARTGQRVLDTLSFRTDTTPLNVSANYTGYYARFPAAIPQLQDNWLVVAATDNTNDLASFSNGCGDARFWCVAAPGQGIYGTWGVPTTLYASWNGTSASAPHASGALAVLKSRLPDMPMSVVRALLLVSADDLGAPGVDPKFGWGLVNLERAITLQNFQRIAAGIETQSFSGNSQTFTGHPGDPVAFSGEGGSPASSEQSGSQSANTRDQESSRGALLMQTKIKLPAALSGVKDKLNHVSVAVSVFGNAHYNARLGDLAQVESNPGLEHSNLGDAAADMLEPPVRETAAGAFFAGVDDEEFRYAGVRGFLPAGFGWQDAGFRLQHNFCEHCKPGTWQEWEEQEWNNDGVPASPFFAREDRNSFLLQMTGDGIRPFAGIGGELHTRGDAPYQQLGLRWQTSNSDDGSIRSDHVWSAAVEVSHIEEDETFLGADFGALGEASSETVQGRIILRSGWGDWRVFGTYEQADSDVSIASGALLESVDGLKARGWKAGIERSHILTGGDRLRFSVGEETVLRGGKAVIRHAVAGCSDGTEGDCFSEAIFGKMEEAPEIYKEREQVLTATRTEVSLATAIRPTFSLGYTTPLNRIGGIEFGSGSTRGHLSLGAEHNPEDGETALSAQLQVRF